MHLCTCKSHVIRFSSVTTKALSQLDLCSSSLPPFLHFSGVLRSNYNWTTNVSEYTKCLNNSLNEKWKPNEKYYYFDLGTRGCQQVVSMRCCLLCCFWLKQIKGRVCGNGVIWVAEGFI